MGVEYPGRPTSHCWCGNDKLVEFSPDYLRCPACETLVIARMPDPDWLISTKDEGGFYGRSYYEKYLIEEFGFPDLSERARADLPERCLYWLRTLLRYRVPPGRVLELGSAHGGFVALLRWAGFDAIGLEVSPWLVEFARRTFDVPMLLGPIEQQDLEPASFDAIAAMDLIEHLPDPVGTLKHCAGLLKPDGILLIQTPCFPEGKTHAELVEQNAPFLRMMAAPNHLYLFSRTSVSRLLDQAGLNYWQFEIALFPYDMFLVAGRRPLARYVEDHVARCLQETAPARMVQAMLDLDERYNELARRHADSEADRAERLEVIERQGRQLGELEAARNELRQRLHQTEIRLAAADADREARREALERAEAALQKAELDRRELHRQIAELHTRLGAAEADRAARLEVIERQGRQLGELEAARNELRQRLHQTEIRLAAADADREARREALERAEAALQKAELDRRELHRQIAELHTRLGAAEADRAARLEVIERQGRQLGELEAARNELRQRLHQTEIRLAAADADREARREALERAEAALQKAELDRRELHRQIAELHTRLGAAEADRAARLEVIERQGRQLSELEAARADLARQLDQTRAELDRYRRQQAALEGRLAELEQQLAAAEADRAARLEVIERQGRQLGELEAVRADLARELDQTRAELERYRRRQTTLEGRLAELDEQLASALAERDAAREEVLAAQSHLEFVRAVLDRLRLSLVYRAMRSLKLWHWLALAVERPRENAAPIQQSKNPHQLKRIAVDLTPVLPGGENGGAKVMTLALIKELARMHPETEFILLTSPRAHAELGHLEAPNVKRLCVSNVLNASTGKVSTVLSRLMRAAELAPWPAIAKITRRIAAALAGDRSGDPFARLEADLLFCPFTAPFFHRPGVSTVSVVYDVQHLDLPDFFQEEERTERHRAFRQACLLSSRLICISEFVRQRVLREGLIPPDRVRTIHITLPHRLPRPTASAVLPILERYELKPKSYLLYPANYWPHKNHEMLLTALGLYYSRRPHSALRLVLTGVPSVRMEFLREAVARMDLGARVIFTGYLPDAEFAALLYEARALIFPSLYEGFGMPLVEAMAAGIPVLASNATSIPEVLGPAGILFDPRKPKEIVAAIERLDDDPGLVEELVARGSARLAELCDEKTMASRYWQVFEEALGSPTAPTPILYGVYPDGWAAGRMTFHFNEGPEDRCFALTLRVPGWIPWPGVTLRCSDLEGVGDYRLTRYVPRGEVVEIRRVLPPASGRCEIVIHPVFQPSALGQGQDQRWLSCRLLNAEIRYPDGSVRKPECIPYAG